MRDRDYGLPPVDHDVVRTFYPLLAGAIMEARTRPKPQPRGGGTKAEGFLAKDSTVSVLDQGQASHSCDEVLYHNPPVHMGRFRSAQEYVSGEKFVLNRTFIRTHVS